MGNIYEDGQLVDLFLSGMRHTKQLQYLSDLASFRTQCDNNPSQISMATIEARFSAIDEDISRGAPRARHINLIAANRNMYTRDKSKKRSFTAGGNKSATNRPKPTNRPSNSNSTHRQTQSSMPSRVNINSNFRCHRCGQRGHIARNCNNRHSASSSAASNTLNRPRNNNNRRQVRVQSIQHQQTSTPVASYTSETPNEQISVVEHVLAIDITGIESHPYFSRRSTKSRRKHRQPPSNANANTNGEPSNPDNWLIDSGASCHMTPFLADLKQAKEMLMPIEVRTADGTKILAHLSGNIDLHMSDIQGNPVKLTLKNCIYVPGITHRVLSTNVMVRSGHRVHFSRFGTDLLFGTER